MGVGDVSDSGGVSTGCETLDALLGDGLERGAVTQFYGPPAAGKTNVALSAAVDVAATDGTAIYIDTEGLSLDRFHQLLSHRTEDVETTSNRIIITEAHDFAEQAEAVQDVTDLATQADLVVLDSATGFYRIERADDEEGGETLRRVADQVTHLLGLARRHDLAVLLTNQVYTDPDSDRVRPLGGHTLQHWTATVVRLERFRGGNRRATLETHRSKPTGDTVQFRITDTGITGVSQDR